MINKAQLKKLINRAGKEGRLLWAYKDGVHYCDRYTEERPCMRSMESR